MLLRLREKLIKARQLLESIIASNGEDAILREVINILDWCIETIWA